MSSSQGLHGVVEELPPHGRGTSCSIVSGVAINGNYPRMGGEHSLKCEKSKAKKELPPHGRGTSNVCGAA